MTVELRQALQERASDLAQRVRRLLGPFSGTEAVLDAGCGTGALAFALALHVAEVVGAYTRVDYLDAARANAPGNVQFLEADVMACRSGTGSSTSPRAIELSTTCAAPSSRCRSSLG